jgi:hypothetical protein
VYVAIQSQDKVARYKGPAFVAQNKDEFKKAAALEGASPIRDLEGPGGGQIVSFDRADDTFFHVIYGQKQRGIPEEQPPTETHETVGPFNGPFKKPRKGKHLRLGVLQVRRLRV